MARAPVIPSQSSGLDDVEVLTYPVIVIMFRQLDSGNESTRTCNRDPTDG